MSSYAEIRDRIETVIRTLTGAHTQWRDVRREMPASGLHVLLHLRSPATVGTPEQRSRVAEGAPAPGQEIVVDVVTQKTIVLSVLAESFNPRDPAIDLISRLQTRLYRPWCLAQLREVNVAVQRTDPAADVSTKYDQRVVSAAVLDIRLAWATTDEGVEFEPADGSTFIERVRLEGDPGGPAVIDSTIPL